MKAALLVLAGALALSACETPQPTRYMPAAGPRAVGFSEQRIEPGRYRITFRGGPGAPEAQVADYALLRAADLALADGFDWFRVYDRRVSEVGGGGPYLSLGVGGASFGRHSAVGGSVSHGMDLGGGPALAQSMEVVMGKGAPPKDADVYDAREIRRAIGPRA